MSEKRQQGKTKGQQIEYLKEKLSKKNTELRFLKKALGATKTELAELRSVLKQIAIVERDEDDMALALDKIRKLAGGEE